jgi:ATP:ADP antiporter, AAA family
MARARWTLPDRMTGGAMLASGLMIAQMTEAKAVRDSVFLTHFPVTSLPTITLIAAIVAIAASYGGSRLMRIASPAIFAPLSFLVSGVLQIGERSLLFTEPRIAACAIYLHVFAINLVLTSSFWSLMNEHYDPRSAKRAFGKIGGAGTLGGVIGGLVAERVAALGSIYALILVTAILHLGCSAALFWFTRQYRVPHHDDRRLSRQKSVRQVLKKTPYLLEVASLMIVVSVAAALLDYLFKSQAAATLSKGPELTRFFAVFYTVTGLLGVAVQAFLSSAIIGRLGLANAVSALPLTVLAGAGWVLAFFGFVGTTLLRGVEVIVRGSIYRSGYEIFYTPVAAEDKRAVKAIIDVTGERLGDFLGSGILALLLIVELSGPAEILGLAIAFSAVGLILAKRLERSYARALEASLHKQAVRLAPEPEDDFGASIVQVAHKVPAAAPLPSASPRDPVLRQLAELRSHDEERIIRALYQIEDPHPVIVHQLIRFLAHDRYAFFAMDHLRRALPSRVGQLADALLDPEEPFAVRKRIPIILASSDSQRALDDLLLALSEREFVVRFRCATAMSQIRGRCPQLYLSQERIWQVLGEELKVSLDEWEQRQAVDRSSTLAEELPDQSERPGDASLEYLFVLLGLVLPQESASMAYRALQTQDRHLRGTALEYLQSVMPAPVFKSLEGLIGDRALVARVARAAHATSAEPPQ